MSRPADQHIRERILEAAQKRLWHYGFRKTTIDEIAADAGVGKGTVYLHFESKEEIALAIMAQFKQRSLEQARALATDDALDPLTRLKEMLLLPLLLAHERCLHSPAAQEMVVAIRPHIQERMKPYQDEEISLLGNVLAAGNQQGLFAVADCARVARVLKLMCAGFWPPHPCVSGLTAIRAEVEAMVDVIFLGLRRTSGSE